MELICIKGIRGSFRKGRTYSIEKYPVEDYYFEAIKDEKQALVIVGDDDMSETGWIKKHFKEA